MCATCGCSDDGKATLPDLQSGATTPLHDDHDHGHAHGHNHAHPHDHGHAHTHDHSHDHGHTHAHVHGTTVELEKEILTRNNQLAERNRGWFAGRNILALNLVSSPGAGKTTLLERTLRDLAAECPWAVIEGDQQTDNDGERIRAAGALAVQVNTG